MKISSIRTKIVLTLGILIIVLLGILISYSTMEGRKKDVLLSQDIVLNKSRNYSNHIKTEMEVALSTAITLSQTLIAIKDPVYPFDIDRDSVNVILKKILEENPSFFSAYTIWEPNAFDNLDDVYVGTAGHDNTGRFIPYWYRNENDEIVLKPAEDFLKEGIGNYYLIPKNTKSKVITNPRLCKTERKDVLKVSFAVPLVKDDVFYGIVGIDLSLDWIGTLIGDAENIYNGNEEIALLTNNGTIAASNLPNLIGKDIKDIHNDWKEGIENDWKEDIEFVKEGKEIIKNDGGLITVFIPIRFGNIQSPWSLNINLPTKAITHEANVQMWQTIGVVSLLSLFVLIIMMILINQIVKPLPHLAGLARRIAVGDLNYPDFKTSDDEIGEVHEAFSGVAESYKEITEVCEAISIGDYSKQLKERSEGDLLVKSINRMCKTLQSVVHQANLVAKGNYSTGIVPRSDKDELGTALVNMTNTLREITEEQRIEDWLRNGNTELIKVMRGILDVDTLCTNIIYFLCAYIKSDIGSVFIADKYDKLKVDGSYGYSLLEHPPLSIKVGDGVIGQAVLSDEIKQIHDIPEYKLDINLGFGKGFLKNILIVPFKFEEIMKGVIVLGKSEEFSEAEISFLDFVRENIAIFIYTSESRRQLQNLLEKTQQQTEELEIQHRKVLQINKEFESQTNALKLSESNLQNQREELKITNKELNEQAKVLEAQKNDIELKNKELRKTQEEIEEKAKRLEISSKFKSDFLANMSHELRTPLNSMLILSNLLTENKNGHLAEKEIEFARIIHSAGSDLLSLIDNILDLSKIESGKVMLILEEINLNDLVKIFDRNFRQIAELKKIEYNIRMLDRVPAKIKSDSQKINQIITNLLSNAIKFTDEKGKVDFIIRPVNDEDVLPEKLVRETTVVFEITDTGIGIPKDKHALVFEAFQQASGITSRKYGGTGLGLPICLELAKMLGGTISLKSDEGEGSSFILYLPFVMPADKTNSNYSVFEKFHAGKEVILEEEKIKENEIPKDTDFIRDDRREINENSRSILIVEGDPIFSMTLMNLANKKGFKSIVTPDADSAIYLADYYQPDAIILDIDEKIQKDLDIIEKLKRNIKTKSIPIHFIPSIETKIEMDEDQNIINKGVENNSPEAARQYEKIINDATSFLNHIESEIPRDKSKITKTIEESDSVLQDKRVLIIDDDMKSLFALSNVFEEKGMKVLLEKDGKEGIRCLEENPYINIIIMDLMMPVMDGYEAIAQIRKMEKFKKIPIIALTAKAMKGDKNKCIEAGANDYLSKPVDTDKLLSMLRVWLC